MTSTNPNTSDLAPPLATQLCLGPCAETKELRFFRSNRERTHHARMCIKCTNAEARWWSDEGEALNLQYRVDIENENHLHDWSVTMDPPARYDADDFLLLVGIDDHVPAPSWTLQTFEAVDWKVNVDRSEVHLAHDLDEDGIWIAPGHRGSGLHAYTYDFMPEWHRGPPPMVKGDDDGMDEKKTGFAILDPTSLWVCDSDIERFFLDTVLPVLQPLLQRSAMHRATTYGLDDQLRDELEQHTMVHLWEKTRLIHDNANDLTTYLSTSVKNTMNKWLSVNRYSDVERRHEGCDAARHDLCTNVACIEAGRCRARVAHDDLFPEDQRPVSYDRIVEDFGDVADPYALGAIDVAAIEHAIEAGDMHDVDAVMESMALHGFDRPELDRYVQDPSFRIVVMGALTMKDDMIAEHLGISEDNVRQRRSRLIRKMTG